MSDNISYRIATESDRAELAVLFEKHYFPNEPFNCGWIDDDPVPEDIVSTLKSLGEGTSFVAVDGIKNAIVGACLTGIDDASSTLTMLEEANQTTNKKWAQYLRLYARIENNANISNGSTLTKSFMFVACR